MCGDGDDGKMAVLGLDQLALFSMSPLNYATVGLLRWHQQLVLLSQVDP